MCCFIVAREFIFSAKVGFPAMKDRLHYLNLFRLFFPKRLEIEQIAASMKACQKVKHRYSALQIEVVDPHCISQKVHSRLMLGIYLPLLTLIISDDNSCAIVEKSN